MSKHRSTKLWAVNVIAFVLLIVLTLTGLSNWLLLPRGFRGGDAWFTLRHFILDVHRWTAVLFIISMVVHWALHWSYIRTNLQRHGLLK